MLGGVAEEGGSRVDGINHIQIIRFVSYSSVLIKRRTEHHPNQYIYCVELGHCSISDFTSHAVVYKGVNCYCLEPSYSIVWNA